MPNLSKPILCAFAVLLPSLLSAAPTASMAGASSMPAVASDGVGCDLPTAVSRVDSLLAEARSHIGKRYKYGSSGDKTFDCSGFTSYVFRRYGYKLNRSSRGQALQGEAVERDELMPGDLVMFSGRQVSKSRVGHVGIVVWVDRSTGDFKFIHADCSRGVTISDFAAERYYSRRYICARRVLSLDDCKLPPVSIGVPVEMPAPEVEGAAERLSVEPMDIKSLCMADHNRKVSRRSRRRR